LTSDPAELVDGRSAVYEVLRAGRRGVRRILLAEGAAEKGRLAQILSLARQREIPTQRLSRHELDRLSSHHHGIAAEVDPYPFVVLDEILARAAASAEPALVLILDLIQDPQNLGALLRTAEAVGAHGVVVPRRGAAGMTRAVVRTSAGACEHLLIAQANLAQAMTELKEAGLWMLGLENSPQARPLDEADLKGPLALVVGSEGEGLRHLVRRTCDMLVRLPMRGKVESLNAAVAGSLALYAAWRARTLTPPGSPGKLSDC